jgi:hypothetical protein
MSSKNIRNRCVIQECVYKYMYTQIVKDIINHIKGQIDESSIYGGYSLEECTLVFLYWLCYYPSYHNLQNTTNIPHSNFGQIFGLIRALLFVWAKKQIGGSTSIQRRMVAEMKAKNVTFACVTLCLDGTQYHIQQAKRSQERHDNISYKYKQKQARNYLVACSMDKVITFDSMGMGARYHDLKHLKHCAFEFKDFIMPGDLILADAGFVGFQKHMLLRNIPILVPYKRKKMNY